MQPRQRILVVDDEEDLVSSIADYLRATLSNVVVDTAGNGLMAWDALLVEPADLVVSDYKMPGLDGLSLLDRVSRKWPGTPTVLLTAFADVQLAIRAINEGHVRQFLTKPVDPDRLRDTARALLEERLARQQREAALRRAAETGSDPPGS